MKPTSQNAAALEPEFASGFPAKHLTTEKEWTDLVLPAETLHAVEEIKYWLGYRATSSTKWLLSRRIGAGFRTLFYGPPGTGKTMTAALLGKAAKLPVYRVDLSVMVSKWVGETEKNLSNIFNQAESNNWILFFDEADALFGKRNHIVSANERFANQQVSYLLQCIEEFTGLVVLASNLPGYIDPAFARRFQSTIHFGQPNLEQRRLLWSKLFAPPIRVGPNVSLAVLAEEHDITGGGIVNVLRYASVMARRRQSEEIQLVDLHEGLRRELQ